MKFFFKKIFLALLFLVLASDSNPLFSQVSEAVKYFPLKVGNIWIYNCNATGMACTCAKRYRYVITSTVVLNSKTYYVFQGSAITLNCSFNDCEAPRIFNTLRMDSSNGNLNAYSAMGCSYSLFEKMMDSLNSRLRDTVKIDCGLMQNNYICNDTSSQNIFGTIRKTKRFVQFNGESGFARIYSQDIGLIESGTFSTLCGQYSTLVGCVINGVKYGDTNFVVGVNQISSEIPEQFSLSQNYPNPFNPTTHIGFRIADFGLVRLTIFDALGREVQMLVNQELKPGTYEVDFDGTNLPSRVYYYKLEFRQAGSSTGSFNETRRMVLVK